VNSVASSISGTIGETGALNAGAGGEGNCRVQKS
jgi:hypothetical protein